MIIRASIIWLGLLVLAIGNGTVREFLISPRTGPQIGHVVSTILLSALICVVAWFTVSWIAPGTRHRALLVGSWWVVLTLAFELLAVHYLFGNSWSKLLADYRSEERRVGTE